MKVVTREQAVSVRGAKAFATLCVLALWVGVVGCPGDDGSSGDERDATADWRETELGRDVTAEDAVGDAGDAPTEDAAPETDVAGDRGDLEPGLVRLSNGEYAEGNMYLTPAEGEEGYLCASRLTPPSYPFTVERINYGLGQGPSGPVVCSATYEHHVLLFAAVGAVPPVAPELLADITVPEAEESPLYDEGRYVTLDLDEPVTLTEGQELFVAIPLMGDFPNVMCISVDVQAISDGSRDYWSNAAAPPYDWVQLDSFGLEGSIVVVVYGRQAG